MRTREWMRRAAAGLLLSGVACAWMMQGCQMPKGFTLGSDMNKEVYSVGWLAGSWVSENDDTVTEEQWMAARGGTMLGMSRTVSGGKTIFFEYMRIEERGGELVYVAMPKSASSGTEFKLAESTESGVVFENTAHDFPQRIRYMRRGDELYARIEGVVNGQAQAEEWTWKRAR